MAQSTPLLVLTNVANQLIDSANANGGPFVHIVSFGIGSGFGYTPLPTDVGFNGTTLYQGLPATFKYIGDNTINIVCSLPPDQGPFDFGEVGIFLEGGMLLGKAVFEMPQTKVPGLDGNLASTFSFNCLIRLETNTVSIFKIDTVEPPDVWDVDSWASVYSPGKAANPEVPLILVKELTARGNSSLLHQSDDNKWTVGTTYDLFGSGSIAGATSTYLDIPKDVFLADPESLITNEACRYVIEWNEAFRSVTTVVESGENLRFTLSSSLPGLPAPSDNVIVYQDSYYLTVPQGEPTPPPVFGSLNYEYPVVGTYQLIVPELPEGWSDVRLTLQAQGAGAGGGGAKADRPSKNDWEGGGGGGGAGSFVTADVPIEPGDVINITVGNRGLGGAGSTSSPFVGGRGGNGSSTVISIVGKGTYTAAGGLGGGGAGNSGGTGGSIGGGNGQFGSGRATGSQYNGGRGGASRFGPGGSVTGGAAPSASKGAGGGGGYAASLPNAMIATPGGPGQGGWAALTIYDPSGIVTNGRYSNLINWIDANIGTVPLPAR